MADFEAVGAAAGVTTGWLTATSFFSGVEVCRRIKGSHPDQRMMVCSAAILGDHERALAALGVDHYLTKPYHPEDLITHITQEIGRCGPSPVFGPAALSAL